MSTHKKQTQKRMLGLKRCCGLIIVTEPVVIRLEREPTLLVVTYLSKNKTTMAQSERMHTRSWLHLHCTAKPKLASLPCFCQICVYINSSSVTMSIQFIALCTTFSTSSVFQWFLLLFSGSFYQNYQNGGRQIAVALWKVARTTLPGKEKSFFLAFHLIYYNAQFHVIGLLQIKHCWISAASLSPHTANNGVVLVPCDKHRNKSSNGNWFSVLITF